MPSFSLIFSLIACSTGTWTVDTWGEDYIETGIPAAEFSDGCSVTFSSFEVEITEGQLLDGNGDAVADLEPARVDLVPVGPHDLGSVEVPAGTYTTARFVIAPDASDSVHVAGELSCGEGEEAETVAFDWSFSTTTTYLCEPDALTVPSAGEVTTELTVHGDHLFYDTLEADDAVLQGWPIVNADADADGSVTLDELEAVSLAPLGYSVGQYSEVEDLAAFVRHLTQTVGHVDGEGHCGVEF